MAKAKIMKCSTGTTAMKKFCPKQFEVFGTERVQDPAIRDAIDRHTNAKRDVADARNELDVAADQLVALMSKKKLTTYLDEQLRMRVDVVSGAARVKVKALKEKKSKGSKTKKSATAAA